MVARLIRKVANTVYRHPNIAGIPAPTSALQHLKVALVTDQLTTDCLALECQIQCLTPSNYSHVLQTWKPDFVFIESAFHGQGGSWRYELAKQPSRLLWKKPSAINRLIDFAKQLAIPVVFWNKDDGAYFDHFIEVAKHCDYVFTSDANCLPRYRNQLPDGIPVDVLMMPYQPAFHYFDGFHFEKNEACFVGSYYRRILNERRTYLDMMFQTSSQANFPINIYDRNHDRLSHRFAFRFPRLDHLRMHAKLSQEQTAQAYKSHAISINVNSVTDSETMVSRRLLEILACGGIVVTNPSRAIDAHFGDFCHVVSNNEEARALFERFKFGPSSQDLEMAQAGAEYVAKHHTWAARLEQICKIIGL